MVDKVKSKLADTQQVPQIGDAQTAATPLVVTGTYTDDDDLIKAWADRIDAILLYHGLTK